MKNVKILSIFFLIFLIGAIGAKVEEVQKQTENKSVLNVATFNLRMDNPNDGVNAWPNRQEMVKGLIRFHDFDIFGTQEGFKYMLDSIAGVEGYAYIGGGRDDGKEAGEHSAIFYKTGRFELLDQGDFWFSQTPDVPGKGWDATCCNRICSWGKFRDKTSNKEFYFFNSHYDHQGKVARRESSKLLLSRIRKIAGPDATVFATGDFNAVPTDEPIVTLASDGLLLDAYQESRQTPYGTTGTSNGFRTDSDLNARIDYIWVTKGTTVHKYGVLNDMPYNRFPSDHFPVMIVAEF